MFFKYLRKYIRQYGWYFWSGFFALAITDVLDVIPPLLVMRGVDQIMARAPANELLKTALIFAGLTISLALIRFHWRMQFGKFHQNVARQLRQDVFDKLTHLGPQFYSKNPTGELMSLVTNDIEAIRMGMGPGLVVLSDSLFYLLTIPPIMFTLSASLTFKSLILLPLLPFFVNWLGKIINRYFLVEQEKFSELSGIVQENISGIRTIKSYVQEKNQERLFDEASLGLRRATEKVALAETFMHPVMEFCVSTGVVILIFFGTDDVVRGAITVGTFVAFQRYISKMVWPMTAIGWGFSLISQASASLKRVDAILNTEPDVSRAEGKPITGLEEIRFKNLNFRYPGSDHWALSGIDFTIRSGETLGVIGSVASGKTTLVSLLCHLYKVEKGEIFIGETDINDADLTALRSKLTLVPQDAFLFSTTIEDNIKYGTSRLLEFEDVLHAAHLAKIDSEINQLPEKYQSHLGERGINLSGGQKQRLTIARALVRKTPVIIFDDSLSSLDAETEKSILKNIFDQKQQQTVIIISHKMSSLSQCDRIVALKEGAIESIGTPSEMRKQSEVYRTLLELQNEQPV